MPATDPQVLVAASSCYVCLGVPLGEAFGLALWDEISQSIAVDPVADFIARAGITDQTQIDAITALHAAAVANNWWDKCDLIYPFVGGAAQAHAQNLKSSNFTITWFGAVTHDANGITGGGGYGDTGYIPSSSGQMLLNSAHISIYRRTVGNAARTYCGAEDGGSALRISQGLTGISNALIAIFDTTAVTGLAAIVRNDAANHHIFRAAGDTSSVRASTNIPNFSLFILDLNSSGASTSPSTANLSSVTAGSGITFAEFTAMNTDFNNFNTAIGR